MPCARFCTSISTSDFGSVSSAFCRSAANACSFTFASILRLSSSFRLDVISASSSSTRAARDAERPHELRVDHRQRRPGDALHRQRELGDLAGDILAVIVGREGDREGPGLALAHPCDRALELGQHPALADDDREVARLAARKRDAVDPAAEVDDHPVAGGRGARHVVVARALASQHLDRPPDVLGTDLRRRAFDRHRPTGRRASLPGRPRRPPRTPAGRSPSRRPWARSAATRRCARCAPGSLRRTAPGRRR